MWNRFSRISKSCVVRGVRMENRKFRVSLEVDFLDPPAGECMDLNNGYESRDENYINREITSRPFQICFAGHVTPQTRDVALGQI